MEESQGRDPMTIGNKLGRRQSALESAVRRSGTFAKKLKTLDGRWSFGRLLFAALYLAIMAPKFSDWDAAQKIVGILGFFVCLWILSRIHESIGKKLAHWESCALVYEMTLARWNRDFKKMHQMLDAHKPWHHACAEWEQNQPHPYAHDLDVRKGLFPLLEGASSPQSARQVITSLLSPQANGTASESFPAAVLKSTSAHRRLEALGYSEELKKSYSKEPLLDEVEEFKKAAELFQAFPNHWLRLLFSVVALGVWVAVTVPTWREFLATAEIDVLVRGLFQFAPIPILGLWVYSPVVSAARILQRRSRTLAALLSELGTPEASSQLKKVVSLQQGLGLIEFRGNPVFWILAHLFLPFDPLVCSFMEFRSRGLLEGLPNLWAKCLDFDLQIQWHRFQWENPDFRSAEISHTPALEATALGHPLLPWSTRVCNDISLQQKPVVLLTGSNMAGKSTFLRALGLNVILAQAGAPVCAQRLVTSISKVYCAIRIDDSLEESTSYFYAEVKRLKWMLDELQNDSKFRPYSSLFLVDEIFKGTNNKERFLGSWHVIRALLDTQGFGMVSTHDLALSKLEDAEKRIVNMHFREKVSQETASLVFDYILRAGPCPTTNALHIMRLTGLPIPQDPTLPGALGEPT